MPVLAIGFDARQAKAGAHEFDQAASQVKKSAKEASDASKGLSADMADVGKTSKGFGAGLKEAERDASGFGQGLKKAADSTKAFGAGLNEIKGFGAGVFSGVQSGLVEYDAKARKAHEAAQLLAKDQRLLAEEATKGNRALVTGVEGLRNSASESKRFRDEVEATRRGVRAFGDESTRSFKGLSGSSRDLERARDAVSSLEAKLIGGLGPGAGVLRSLGVEAGGAATQLEAVAASAGLSTTALAGIAVGTAGLLAVAGAAAAAVHESNKLEESLSAVNARLDPSEGNLDVFKEQLLELQAASRKPFEELAAGLFQVQTSGVPAGDSMRFLADAVKLSRANTIPLTDAIRILDDTMDSFDLTADRTSDTVEKLTVGARIGGADFRAYGNAVASVGTVAGPLKVSLTEIETVLSGVTKAGVPAEAGASGLRNALVQLSDPTSALSKRMRELGLETGGEAIAAKGLIGVLGDIKSAIGDSPEQLASLFSSPKTAAALFAATKQSAGDAADAAKRLAGNTGEVGKSIDRIDSEAGAKIGILTNQFTNFLTKIGAGYGDFVKSSYVKVIETINGTPITAPSVELPHDLGSSQARLYLSEIEGALKAGDTELAQSLTTLFQGAQKRALGGQTKADVSKYLSEITDLQRDKPDQVSGYLVEEAKKASLALTDVGSEVGAIAEKISGSFKATEDGIKRVAKVATDVTGKMRIEFADVKVSQPVLEPSIQDRALKSEIDRALAPFKRDPIEIPLAPVVLPKDVEAARQLVETLSKKRTLDPGDSKQEAELKAALGILQRYQQAQQQAARLQLQISAQTATGTEKEVAGYHAAEAAIQDSIDALETLLGKTGEVDQLRASLDKFKAANQASTSQVGEARRAQILQQILGIEASTAAKKADELSADKSLADSEAGRAAILKARISVIDYESQAAERALHSQFDQYADLNDEIERGVKAIRERAAIEKQAATLAVYPVKVYADQANGLESIAEASRAAADAEERRLAILEEQRRGQQTYFQLLEETSSNYQDQTKAVNGLRDVERSRLKDQLTAGGIVLQQQQDILDLYDKQTSKIRDQARVQESLRRSRPKFDRTDEELGSDTAKELRDTFKGLSEDSAEFQERFDALYRSKKNLRDFVGGAAGSISNELTSFATDAESAREAVTNLGKTIESELIDRLVSKPLANYFSDFLGSAFGGLFGGGGGNPGGGSGIGWGGGGGQASARGNVFDRGSLVPFAQGGAVSSYSDNGIFNRPTVFPMANGATGLAGEAGTEGIFPLKRGPDGKLGVQASGGGSSAPNVTTINVRQTVYARDAGSFRSSERQILGNLRKAARGMR